MWPLVGSNPAVGDRLVDEGDAARLGARRQVPPLLGRDAETELHVPLVRLLFVGIALILRNVWVWLHLLVLSTPQRGGRQLRLDKLRFRTLLLWLVHLAEALLGFHDAADAYEPTEP